MTLLLTALSLLLMVICWHVAEAYWWRALTRRPSELAEWRILRDRLRTHDRS